MPNKRLSKEDKLQIVELYTKENKSANSIAKIFGVKITSVLSLLRRRGIECKMRPKRKYFFNESFFDKIDTEEKAYFLGLLYADGYNNLDKSQIDLTLQEEDKHILDNFNKLIGYEKELKYLNRKLKYPNWKNCYKLSIYSNKICKKLAELGCTPRKSLTIKFPDHDKLPTYLINHFIRGYFDGDGCFYLNYKNGKSVQYCNIVSTVWFCEKTKEILDSIGIISKILTRKKPNANEVIKELFIYKKEEIKKFLNYIYKDSSVKLNRKYLKYLEFLQCF